MSSSTRHLLWVTLLGAVLCIAPRAEAQRRPKTKTDKPTKRLRTKRKKGKPSAAAMAEARRRFMRGNRLYRQGNYAEALLAYQAAMDLYEEPVILYNIAQTYEKLRDPARAATMFERYLATSPKARDRSKVLARIARLKRRARVEVHITSYPSGAAIYVGRRSEGVKGRTPIVLKLPLGKQRVTLDLAGFVRETRLVHVRLDRRNLLDVQLQRKSSIRVDTDPPGARVFIDKNTIKQSFPAPHRFEVAPGQHMVHVVGGGYQRVDREVVVRAGDQVSLLVNLKALPRYGQVQVDATAGAVVVIDGRTVAHVPMRPLRLAAGTYRVTVNREGYQSWEGKVNVAANRLTVARVTLSPLRGPVAKSILYGSVGLSVGALITGAVFGVLALRSEREYSDLPVQEKLDDGKSQALIADSFFAAAAASALAAVVTYLATRRGPSEADITLSTISPIRPAGASR